MSITGSLQLAAGSLVNAETDDIYDFLAGKGAIKGDLVSPALSSEAWGELK
jgi:hypothetical protein